MVRPILPGLIPTAFLNSAPKLDAFWIEVKPRDFTDTDNLSLRKSVAENYIRHHGYDWEYKIVYGDEIKLTLDQVQQFNECCRLIGQGKRLPVSPFSLSSLFAVAGQNNRVEFVMFGTRRHFRSS